MSATIGKAGSVRFSTIALTFVDSYTINTSIDTVEITGYGSTFKSRASTLKDWNGSFTFTMDRSDTNHASIFKRFETGSTFAETVSARFYTSSVAFWSGSCIPTGCPIQSKVGDKVSCTMNFVGTGALSYTTST